MEKYELWCTSCDKSFVWEFTPDSDFEDMDDIIEYHYRVTCPHSTCIMKVKDGMNIQAIEPIAQ